MPQTTRPTKSLDVRGYLCPIPVLKAEAAMADLERGQVLEIRGDDPVMVIDIPAWCDDKGHQLIACRRTAGEILCIASKG